MQRSSSILVRNHARKLLEKVDNVSSNEMPSTETKPAVDIAALDVLQQMSFAVPKSKDGNDSERSVDSECPQAALSVSSFENNNNKALTADEASTSSTSSDEVMLG